MSALLIFGLLLHQAQAGDVKRINVAELKSLMADNGALVFDVRDKRFYDIGHIPGAQRLSRRELTDEQVAELRKEQRTIVLYCS